MFSRRSIVSVLALVSLLVFAACGGTKAGDKSATLKTIDDRFAVKLGDHTVQMQLAAEAEEMQRGLMYRESMGREEGMLFIYRSPQQMSFWMRNTQIALDIGFFDASGELKEIYPMYPHDERSVSSHAKNLQYALEMNQGWYRESGIKPGAKLDLAAVAEGLKARGMEPAAFGLR